MSFVVKGVDNLFVASFLSLNSISESFLSIKKVNSKLMITNPNILDRIHKDFSNFKDSKLSLDDYFDRDIIICNLDQRTRYYKIKKYELKRKTIILGKNKKSIHSIRTDQLISDRPIRMNLSTLMSIYGKEFEGNDSNQLVRLDTSDKIGITFFWVKGKTAHLTNNLPGASTGKYNIKIGHNGKDWFWLPSDNLIRKTYVCQENKGKCKFETDRKHVLDRHKKTCTDKTKVISKQVNRHYKIQSIYLS